MAVKITLPAGSLRHLIRIQRPAKSDAFDGAGSGTWDDVVRTRAAIEDMLPSRGEKFADGLNVASRPSRVRIRFRRGIGSNMRVLVGRMIDGQWQTDRTAQIVTQPAELGFRQGLEFVIEDYSTSGNAA